MSVSVLLGVICPGVPGTEGVVVVSFLHVPVVIYNHPDAAEVIGQEVVHLEATAGGTVCPDHAALEIGRLEL